MVPYIMSLVHKIPPIISALAFGYGVGMAAPDSAISSVSAVVTVPGPARIEQVAAPVPAQVAAVTPRVVNMGVGGRESSELSRLREVSARDAQQGAACSLDRPTFSKAPSYESTPSRPDVEVDDLDDASAEAVSRLQLPDVRIPITRRTLKYVRFFTRTDRGRRMFETWLKRSGRYQELIQTELRERHLPEDLIWLAMIESGFDPRAKSPAGAVGLWQFMPATGAVYGLARNRHIDQRKNPRLATQAALHHLRDLYMRFGAWDLALAAYNMGYEQLLDRIDRYGTADFNELARQEALPSETASYVPKIMAAAIVANNLERFGFDGVEVSRPLDAAEIAVPPGTPLKILAKAAGVSTRELRTLNPDILSDRLPPGRGDFIVLLPSDTVSRARAALPAMLQDLPIADDASVLDPVDLLGGRDFVRKTMPDDQRSLLSLLPRYKKRRSLRDPVEPLAAADDTPADERDEHAAAVNHDVAAIAALALDQGDQGDQGDDEPEPRRKVRRASRTRATVMYRIGPGDTLLGIARQFAVDVDDISKLNKVEDDKLKVGSLLKLHVRRDVLRGLQASRGAGEEGKSPKKEAKPTKSNKDKDKEQADAARHHQGVPAGARSPQGSSVKRWKTRGSAG